MLLLLPQGTASSPSSGAVWPWHLGRYHSQRIRKQWQGQRWLSVSWNKGRHLVPVIFSSSGHSAITLEGLRTGVRRLGSTSGVFCRSVVASADAQPYTVTPLKWILY